MTKKILAVLLALVMVFSAAACTSTPSGNNSGNTTPGNNSNNSNNVQPPEDNSAEQKRFAEFVDKQYIYSIESDYSTAHIYYSDWEAAGLNRDNIEISFGEAPTEAGMQEDRDYYNGLQKELATFDRSKLTPLQQDEYDALEWEIGSVLAMADEKFDYYSQIFTPPNSLESNIVALFTSWELRNEQDVKDVITLIGSIPSYVDGCLEYAKKQQEKNLLMTNFDDVIDSCKDILDFGLDSYAIKCIMDQVDKQESISKEQKDKYKAEIKDAFKKYFLPSIKKISDTFKSIKKGNNITGSYASLPNGKEYYEALLNYRLGYLGKSALDIKYELQKAMTKHYSEIVTTYQEHTLDANAYYSNRGNTKYTDYTAILEDVKVKMLEDHPEVKDLKYEILNADPEEKLDEKNVAAYFIIPPVDGDGLQRMRVNPSNKEFGSVDTYMTVTHEGFPGHMYQYAYAAENIPSDYIKTLGVDAIVEGYAVYSQYGALNYLKTPSVAYRDFARYNEMYAYAVYSAVDICINYEGYDVEGTKSFFVTAGFNVDTEAAQEIYDLLRLNPAYYGPYGYGYEFLAGLRENAEKELGDKFSALEFNKALLDAGPSPCKVVTNHVNSYIESVKAASQEAPKQ